MKSEVYFAGLQAKHGSGLYQKIVNLFYSAGMDRLIQPGDLVAIKLHFGEPGNLAFTSPLYLKPLVEEIKKAGGKPFLTDSNTLYVGGRRNAVDHLQTAYGHGFVMEVTGAPVIIADGLKGQDFETYPIQGKYFDEVRIVSAVYHAPVMIVFTHFKGHPIFGFGGAFKNVGMGCASPSGKQKIHSDLKPKIKPVRCLGCSLCLKRCPAGAIYLTAENKARITAEKCIGCAECTVICPSGAVIVQWKSDPWRIQEKLAEYCWGILKQKEGRVGFYNFLLNISPGCDCEPWNDVPIVSDLGILASLDPVSIEQTSLDLVNEAPPLSGSSLALSGTYRQGQDKFKHLYQADWEIMLDYAVELGLGQRDYRLTKIS